MRSNVWIAFRTNLGVVEAAVFIYCNPSPDAGLLGTKYLDHRHHLPIPPQNLNKYQLENGLAVTMTRSMEEWHLTYEGSGETELGLHFKALMPPVHISEIGTVDAQLSPIRYGHLDQMMMVTGSARVRGEDFLVDWPAWRDQSWSPRPEASSSGYGTAVSSNFDYGSFGPDLSFLVQTRNDWSNIRRGVVTSGYILEGDRVLRIRSGLGEYEFMAGSWVISGLRYELEDEKGRTHVFTGVPRSYGRFPITSHLACVEWVTDGGDVGWGEYLWHGDLYRMQEALAGRDA
jgi:hypothetical protein